MKLVILILTLAPRAFANFATCSHYVEQSPKMARAVSYLQSVEGTYQLGDCAIELHVCSNYANDNGPGSLVGDLLIRPKSGQERYVQLEFPDETSPHMRVEILNGKVMFHYESDNRNQTDEFGRRESVRLEFLKSDDGKKLVSIDEGWFATKDWEARRKGSVYHWLNCQGAIEVHQ